MTITSKYFVQTPTGDNLNVLDVELAYGHGAITTAGETIQYNGSDAVDAFWVRPGLSYDLQSTGNGIDKIYFTGNLADYTLTANATDATLTLSRLSTRESIVINGGSTGNYDNLVFKDGFVNSSLLYKAAKNSTALPALVTSETSLNPAGAAATGAVLNDTIKAFAINQNGETFATTKPGVKLVISGAGGVDQVYVADGTNVDATDTGAGNDLIYMRGKWSDYTKTTDVSGNTITFTRLVGTATETVKVTGGSAGSHDTVIFADGSAQTNDAFITLKSNPTATTAQISGLGFSTAMVTPLISDPVIAASIATLQAAAHSNNATLPTPLTETVYKNTDAKNVVTGNVAAYNSALDSAAIDNAQVTSTADVQKIVDAFNAILASADGVATPNTTTALTGTQYAAVGVTSAPTSGNALALLDNVVDVSATTAVDTTGELQDMVNAANIIAAATGQGMGTTVTAAGLAALGITGNITPTTIAAIEAAIGAATQGTLNTKAALQALVDTATSPTVLAAALAVLQTAATNNTAATLTATDYAKAGLTGVTDGATGNIAALNSALNSVPVTGTQLGTEALAQGIVDAYKAILASADGVATPNTTTALTGAQYAAVGVTSAPTSGNALALLDNVVDVSATTAVDTTGELQDMVNAANIIAAATGQGMGTTVTAAGLAALGITGNITPTTIAAIEAAIGAATQGTLNTKAALQALVDTATSPTALAAALTVLQTAATNNTAATLTATDYAKAGLTGVTDGATGNIAALNSALNSVPVTGTQLGTEALAQGIVDAYKAILASADGVATPNTTTALTGTQYAAVGVTSAPTSGNALALLDNVVDVSATTAVDTTGELQDMVNAANIIAAATGQGMGTTVTAAGLAALGITGNITPTTIAAIEAAIGAATQGTLNTKAALQALVDTATSPTVLAAALAVLQTAATNNTAATLTATDYAKAGLTGVTDGATGNIAALNSALNSVPVTGTQLGTEALAQGIVDAYKAILASADSTPSTPATSLTGEVYSLIGVTGLQASGAPAAGSSLSLLDSVIDVKATADVNTEGKVQALADEANRVMAAAGQTSGTPTLSGADLTALGVTGLTANNTQAVINAIVAQTSDVAVDTLAKLQAVVTSAETKAATALSTIGTAAHNNTAASQSLAASVYSDAGVSGLTTSGVTNATLLGAVNSALDSQPVDTPQVSTTAAVQTIVNDYSAILASADGTAANTTTALTGNQYADVGVTGISGASAPAAGTSVFLLDSAVDAKLASAVDTVGELQDIATAAIDVIAAANHGTASVTGAELTALGVTGDFSVQATVDAINAVIHSSATIAVDTLSELQSIANAAAHPVLSSALSNVANLDVMSNLVFTSTSAVQLGTSGLIHITQTGGAGYGGEAAAGNSQDIDLATALGRGMVSIDSTGTKITINPAWDLDLGATYSISIDAGAFVSTDTLHLAANAVTGMTFGTVTPGAHTAGNGVIAADAHASQMMDSTGALAAGHNWLNIGGLGDSTSAPTLLGSLSTGTYALVLENYATTQSDAAKGFNGIKAHDTNVSVTSFGADDLIYFDAQANNASTQRFDASLTNLINGNGHGGVAGQTGMELGLVSSPTQSGSSAQILMGFVGNTTNQIFPSVYTSTDGQDLGFGTFLGSTPVLMG